MLGCGAGDVVGEGAAMRLGIREEWGGARILLAVLGVLVRLEVMFAADVEDDGSAVRRRGEFTVDLFLFCAGCVLAGSLSFSSILLAISGWCRRSDAMQITHLYVIACFSNSFV
jgi:hypothetical protein